MLFKKIQNKLITNYLCRNFYTRNISIIKHKFSSRLKIYDYKFPFPLTLSINSMASEKLHFYNQDEHFFLEYKYLLGFRVFLFDTFNKKVKNDPDAFEEVIFKRK